MLITPLEIEGPTLITPPWHADARGHLEIIFQSAEFAKQGWPEHFVQEMISFSPKRGTLRGLHFQRPPAAQAKLLHLLSGKLYDVMVDMREKSKTFGKHVAVTLDAEENRLLYVPAGFAHGFVTLMDATRLLYKVSAPYRPECEGGVRFDDPDLGIHWPFAKQDMIFNDRDAALPPLSAQAPIAQEPIAQEGSWPL